MNTNFDNTFLTDATDTLRAMAHPIRISIVTVLFQKQQLTVTEIFEQLGIEQAVTSHHLQILKNQNILYVKREGRNSLYSLRDAHFYNIIEVLTKVV